MATVMIAGIGSCRLEIGSCRGVLRFLPVGQAEGRTVAASSRCQCGLAGSVWQYGSHGSSAHAHTEMVQLLLQARANRDLLDYAGGTAYQLVEILYRHTRILMHLCNL